VSVGGDKGFGCCIFRVKGVRYRGACSLLRGGVGSRLFIGCVRVTVSLLPATVYDVSIFRGGASRAS